MSGVTPPSAVPQGTQFWGAIQREDGRHFRRAGSIARDISRGLRLKLAPKDEALLTTRRTENPAAYRLYLLSRHLLNKGTPEGLKEALEFARQATETDPSYAPAYVALADSYQLLGDAGQFPYREAYSRARAAATRALEIDETLPGAHTALAKAVMALDWDWAGAERGFRRAIELNPSSADVHQGYECSSTRLWARCGRVLPRRSGPWNRPIVAAAPRWPLVRVLLWTPVRPGARALAGGNGAGS